MSLYISVLKDNNFDNSCRQQLNGGDGERDRQARGEREGSGGRRGSDLCAPEP